MPLVLAAIGPESLGELLTEIALEHWPAAAVGDVLPALHVLDPDEADEPAVAIALDRAGSWTGLLSLTGRELVDQPFIQARPVLNTLFGAVLVRLAHPYAGGRQVEAHAPAALAAPAAPADAVVAAELAPEPAAFPAGAAAAEAVEETAGRDGERVLDADSEPVVEEVPRPEAEPVLDAAEEPAPEPAAAEASALEAEGVGGEPFSPDDHDEQAERHEPADVPEVPEVVAGQDEDEPVEAAPPAASADHADHAEPEAHAKHPEHATEPEPEADFEHSRADAEHAEPDAEQPEHAEPDAEQPEHAEHPEPEHAAPDAAYPEPEADAGYAQPEAGAAHAEPDEADAEHAESAEAGGEELSELIEAAFAGLDDKSWAVAQNRVFTDEPSAVDQLAKLFAVPPADISATEQELRVRLDQWLASEEAAPYRAHLDELRRTLGPAAPKEQLIGAADWHAREIRALEVPAWQFVLATLPAQSAQPNPPVEFQQPHSAFAAMQPPPPMPPPPVPSPPVPSPPTPSPPPPPMPPPPAVPVGPPQFQAFTPVAPPPAEGNGGAEQNKPYQPLKDVSQTRRCFRQPDGRWWLRIDVTAEQLAGGECALPTGFAAYLGLSPGESRAVRSAAGELTMTWHGRPVLESIERLLVDVGAKEGGHLFLTLSDEGVLRARHLPVAAQNAESITKALRLVGYTAPGGTRDQAARVIATRIGLTGPVGLPDLLTRLRERGDRDLLALLD
ncbi:hypothetical protein [Nonomuraea sp. NPDC001831]|uniref:hypothetical protein n=1 Tax=Nonomuraea sp. NPDC001831 TaxID=3364340 RepID=UPI00367B7E5D